MQIGQTLWATAAVCLGAIAAQAQPVTLILPETATVTAQSIDRAASYAMPIGPFVGGHVPTRLVEGTLSESAWRIDTPGLSTLELLAPLRAQLAQSGFQTLFTCAAQDCGGFDFRFATRLLPEPDMHVDLGDYRYLAAQRGDELVSVMVSRTARAGFVQLTQIGPQGAAVTGPADSPAQTQGAAAAPAQPVPAPGSLAARLVEGGSVPLDDLVFASGSVTLADRPYRSLQELADWLRAHPQATVALVGHSDASGKIEVNLPLSLRRADAVRDHLIRRYGVAAQQVAAQGAGYLAPRATNLTEDGRKKNRRVEVMLTSTLGTP